MIVSGGQKPMGTDLDITVEWLLPLVLRTHRPKCHDVKTSYLTPLGCYGYGLGIGEEIGQY